jgi:multidrug resistance efflux pump
MNKKEKRYRLALEDIISPLAYLQRKADESDSQLSGMAYEISQSRSLTVEIAKEALKD